MDALPIQTHVLSSVFVSPASCASCNCWKPRTMYLKRHQNLLRAASGQLHFGLNPNIGRLLPPPLLGAGGGGQIGPLDISRSNCLI